MNLKKQSAHKKMNLKRFFNSVKYSIEGLAYAYKNEQSLWTHAGATILAVILGLIFKINFYEWAVIVIALVIVLAVELLNTAIEAVVDMVTKEFNPLAKIAKDCGSAAAFVSSLIATAICLAIFIPYVIDLF